MPIRRSEILLAKFLIYTVGRSQPYAYEECDKSSTRSYGLKAHMITHSGNKFYACDECDKSFRNNLFLLSMYKLTCQKNQ